MYITSPDPPKKILEEYDFSFGGGMGTSVTIDKEAGDIIDLDTYPHAIVINQVPKPSVADPTQFIPAEQITIFTANLLTIHKRIREVEQLTQEQQADYKLAVQRASKTIQ